MQQTLLVASLNPSHVPSYLLEETQLIWMCTPLLPVCSGKGPSPAPALGVNLD